MHAFTLYFHNETRTVHSASTGVLSVWIITNGNVLFTDGGNVDMYLKPGKIHLVHLGDHSHSTCRHWGSNPGCGGQTEITRQLSFLSIFCTGRIKNSGSQTKYPMNVLHYVWNYDRSPLWVNSHMLWKNDLDVFEWNWSRSWVFASVIPLNFMCLFPPAFACREALG